MLAHLSLIRGRTNKAMMMRFGGSPKCWFSASSHKISDWEYVAQIHKSLKDNKINEAINYLINSHLEGVILDRQTFHNVYVKMSQAKVADSYQQLAYKLYRESFSPHILMVEWMKALSQTKNIKLYEQLQKDFKQLNIEMPTAPTAKEEMKVQLASTNGRSSQKTDANRGRAISRQYVQSAASPPAAASETQIKTPEQPKEASSHASISPYVLGIQQMTRSIQQLVKILQNNEIKISIHDVELEMKSEEEVDIEEEEDDEDDKAISQYQVVENSEQDNLERLEETIDQLNELINSVSKIKIGKIDFSSTSISKNPNNDNNNNSK